jgi:hypothetical protein
MEPVAATKATIVAATAANKIVEQSIDPNIAAVAADVAAVAASIKAQASVDAASLMTAGQRKVNILWECTQAAIAVMVTVSNLGAASYLIIKSNGVDAQMPMLVLSSAFSLIIGFYFARTNHQAIGGVGTKPDLNQKYEGR